MITQFYPYYPLKQEAHYIFESEGVKGSVFKIVALTLAERNIWNLGFGDLKTDGFVNDSIITNNQDAAKVIRTVAKIAIDFLAQNPESTVEIKPVDAKRKRLYNSVFQRYYEDIEPLFNLSGFLGAYEESYSPLKSYDKFRITFKFNINYEC